MSNRLAFSEALRAREGIFRLEPTWVPRSFMVPGGRLRLHPDDLYALGGHRGGINERWFSSTTRASNGPNTPPNEGLSFVRAGEKRFLLKDAVEEIGDELLGAEAFERERGWNLLCKFFDNLGPIPHHMHQSDAFAKLVGQKGKPEAYYFPPQYNMKENNFPYTFMRLEPGTTRDDVRQCLANWEKGDNGILNHSRAYRLIAGTGWHIKPGLLHAPGSLVTYEPQVNSDVFAMFQSLVDGRIVDHSLLVKDVLPEYWEDLDYLVSMLDWEENVNPEFAASNRVLPMPARPLAESESDAYRENWITYGTRFFSAKELTVLPGRKVKIRDNAAYGTIVVQGHGKIGPFAAETPSLIRFGQSTRDEFFVSFHAASESVAIENLSETEPLVLLKHFGPGNPDAEPLRKDRN